VIETIIVGLKLFVNIHYLYGFFFLSGTI